MHPPQVRVCRVDSSRITVRRSGIARCSRNRLALRIRLLRRLLKGLQKASQVSFTIPVAGTDHRRHIIVHCVLQGIKDVQSRGVPASINVKNSRILGDTV